MRHAHRRRGVILILAAFALSLGAIAVVLSLQTSQRLLAWKMMHARAEAAAMAGALELDGTAEGIERAQAAAREIAGAEPNQIKISSVPDGDGLRVTISRDVAVAAMAAQREVSEPPSARITIAAPKPEAEDFGFLKRTIYRAAGKAEVGRVVAVQVHSGYPKEIPLSWISGRVVTSTDDHVEMEYLGGYLRGVQHGAVKSSGYFEVRLGGGDLK